MNYDLSKFSNPEYNPGPVIKRIFWLVTSVLFFESFFPWPSSLKSFLLRIFGATIGNGVVFKPHVQIKYPWFLQVGNHSWIGEHVWIDNLGQVSIGSNSVLSQGVYLCTGNHNYKKETFDLMVGPITIGSSVWVGAKAVLSPGITITDGVIISLGSVVKKTISEEGVYGGNPAEKVR